MSQNDFTIANQGFPAFRADLNSALQALASNSSGATAPSTTFANMWWYDSANNIMYIRNEDNDAWIKFAELDQTNDKFVLSGTLQLDDGTVSAPALTFNSDTNMGIYRGGTDILKFVTAGTDAVTIDASQNLLVGTTDNELFDNTSGGGLCYRPSLSLDIAREATSSSNSMLTLNNTGVDARFIDFRKDATTVGAIGVSDSGDRIYLAGGGLEGVGIDNGANAFVPTSEAGAFKDNHLSLGRSDARFTDLYLSSGVYLGGTGSANQLDDYEEGTFTATLEGSTTNPNTPVTLSSARYTKIGRQVMVQGQFTNVDTTGASGGVRVTGLPFTASTAFASGNVMTYVRFTLGTTSTNISPYVSGTQIAFYQSTTGAGWGEIAHSAGNGAYLAWTAIYDTN